MYKGRKNHTNIGGGITIFLSITMLIIFALIGTLIESARVSAANARIAQVSQVSIQSVFSKFAREVFSDYGILLLWENDQEVISGFENYLRKNIDYKKEFIQKNNDLLGIQIKKLETREIVHATDDNGVAIANQIYDYMKYRIAGDAVNALLSKCNLLSQGEQVTDFFDKINHCSEKFKEVEESVAGIKKAVDNVKKMSVQPKEYIEKMRENLNKIKQIDMDAAIRQAQGNYGDEDLWQDQVKKDELFEEFKKIYEVYNSDSEKLMKYLVEINAESNEYFQAVKDSETLINHLKQDLEEKKDIDSEMYEIMENEVKELENQIVNQNIDVYKVRENYSYSTYNYEKMNIASEKLENVNSYMEGILYNNLALSQIDSEVDYIGCFMEELEEATKCYDKINLDNLNVKYDKEEVEGGKSSVIDTIQKIMKNGWLAVVTDNISSKQLEKGVPSETSLNTGVKENIWGNLGMGDQAIRKALMGQYILDYFICYTDREEIQKENKLLDYEIEYILGGYKNDRDNLEYVTKKIIAIREGFNLIYLFKDSDCRESAHLLAISLVGFTGMPIIIRLTQLLIMGAWAYAESLIDARDLVNGYKVKMLKSDEDWNLSLDDIGKITDKNHGKQGSSGLSYKDYLRFLLFTENTGEQTAGILDMIQVNIQNRYNDDFSLEECILKLSVKVECRVEHLFTSLRFVKRIIRKNVGEFVINSTATFSY